MFSVLEIMPKMHGDTALLLKLIYIFVILVIFKLTKTMPSVNKYDLPELSLLSPVTFYQLLVRVVQC